MAKPKVDTSVNSAKEQILALENHINSMQDIDMKFQFFIAELTMLRLFAIVETGISDIAYRLATGSKYLNGITPVLIAPACGTIDNARNMMMTYNRGGTARSLKWTQSGEIKKNIEHVLDETDFFYVNIANHSAILTEMRKVRNYIAHKNKGSRQGFSEVVRARYGGKLKIQVGAFLISKKRHTPSNLSRYFTVSKILIDDISKGF